MARSSTKQCYDCEYDKAVPIADMQKFSTAISFRTTSSQGVNDKVALTNETFVLELIHFGGQS